MRVRNAPMNGLFRQGVRRIESEGEVRLLIACIDGEKPCEPPGSIVRVPLFGQFDQHAVARVGVIRVRLEHGRGS